MESRRLCILLALLFFFISMEINLILAQGNGNGNGNNNGGSNNGKGNGNGNSGGNNGNNNGNGNTGSNNGNGNGNGNTGSNNGNGNGNGNAGSNNGNGNGNNGKSSGDNSESNTKQQKRPADDAATTNYDLLSALPRTGQERAFCKARGKCHFKTLTCPAQCPQRKPKNNKKQKGCFINCSSRSCEATCKWRKPKCNGYGSLCYDPRFVGGDGVMFYFHGSRGSDFAIVSDYNLHINAHLIGTRPQGRTRDFTWVQALSIMFDTHTLVVAAKKVDKWDNAADALVVKWDGESVSIPTDGEAEWRINTGERGVTVERTDDVNTVRVHVTELVEIAIRVTPIGEEENRIHKYGLDTGRDAFAHLETQFTFFSLSDMVEGVLGQTYRPGYVSPVKRGVAMPVMGGEDKYQTPSLYSPSCKLCRFKRPSTLLSAA